MQHPGGILKRAILVLAALVLLAVVAAVPFLVKSQLTDEQGLAGIDEATACWGCAPYERLLDLFELQILSLRPRIRQLERRAEETGAPTSGAGQTLQNVEMTLAAAESAAGALRTRVATCRADTACRRDPSAFLLRTCPSSWPDEALSDRLLSLADEVYATGASCRDLACPLLNCETRSVLAAVLDETTATIADLADGEGNSPASVEATQSALDEARRALERLPLTLSDPTPGALLDWAEGAQALALMAPEETRPFDVRGPLSWRVRLVRSGFRELVSVTGQPGRNEAPLGWDEVADRAASIFSQIQYIDWFMQNMADGSPCESVNEDRVAEIAARNRQASAALALCGARGGCSEGGATSPMVPLTARSGMRLAALDTYVEEAIGIMRRSLVGLELGPDEPVSLRADLERYGPGEAMRIRFGETANRCLSAGDARVALYADGANGEAMFSRELNDSADDDGILIAAPDQPGSYVVRAFAPASRGGAELAHQELAVGEAPGSCTGFTGTWDTNFGTLRLYEREGAIRGTYRRDRALAPGFLTGEVDGRVLYGEWQSELGRGGARLVLASSGTFFRGSWSHIPGRFAGTGSWIGECVLETGEVD